MVTVGHVAGALAAAAAVGALASPAVALPLTAMPLAPGGANPTSCGDPRPGRIPLPRPEAALALQVPGTLPDRLRVSRAPGPVDDRDQVDVALGPEGQPARVTVEQRLRITGTGDYGIYERGPARRADALDDTSPPVAKLGTVVWQGFSPGRRDLAARLTLDPGIEALRLPLGVRLEYVDALGAPQPLGAGGTVPGPGTVTVTLSDQTSQQAVLVGAGSTDASELAGVADALLGAAASPGREPPVAGRGLPCDLSADLVAQRQITVGAAQTIRGTIRVVGSTATVAGPGTTPISNGARIAGSLPGGQVAFTARVSGRSQLVLDLTTQPTLDRRTLSPPTGFTSWAQWAAGHPSSQARRAATDTVIAAAAAAVRAADYYPYLQADLPGRAQGLFRYSLDRPAALAATRQPLRPKRGAIGVVVLAASLIFATGAVLRRLS
ncbi:MAG: hypothetical protein QOJ92_1049 [Frankiales bacterium]|nr:hypothetical protein [Frankiales bacterium]